MAKAKKLPSGMWRCQISCENERRSFTAYTKKEAEYLALEWQTGRKQRRLDGLTIQQAGEKYIEIKAGVLSPKTTKENAAILRNLPNEIKEMPLSKIDQDVLQLWVSNLTLCGLAPKTIRNRYAFVKAIVRRYAHEIMLKVELPQPEKTILYIPNHREVAHLIEVCREKDGELETAVLLAAKTGLRRGEISALQNKKERFKDGVIEIKQAFVEDKENRLVLKSPKSYTSIRTLTAPKALKDNLLEVPLNWEYVTRLKPHNITQRLETVIKKEFDTPFRLHDLRHYYCSVLLRQDIPERYIMKMMGHSTPSMVRKVYSHIFPEDLEADIIRVNTFFDDNDDNMHTEMHTTN